MIHVPFVEPGDPVWVRWKARAQDAQRAHRPGTEPDGKIYRAVKRWLLIAFRRKCAYCERAIRGHAVRLDHFRPKRFIRKWDGTNVSLRDQSPEPHPGYYYLVYDWENLLPACEQCNLAKSNRFHTADEWWAEERHEMAREAPLLVHPSREDPEGLLRFEPDGFVYPARSDDQRARYIIETLDLNREELREDRAEAWEYAEEQMKTLLLRMVLSDQARQFEHNVTRVQEIWSGQAEFSAVKQRALDAVQKDSVELIKEVQRRAGLAESLTRRKRRPA